MLKDFFSKKKYSQLGIREEKENPLKTKKIEKKVNTSKEDTSYDKIQDSRIDPRKRIDDLLDRDTFLEYDRDLKTSNPIDFPQYDDKVEKAQLSSKEVEAVITGQGKIRGQETVLAVMNPSFMMGSMGSVVGEKITRAIEKALEKKLPIIIFTASGGARMQEGILSLMQMAKTSAALGRLGEAGLPYISVLTNPTTGGVTASFAMLGDIILAEPKALICFAGPRVIEQTIKQKLPEGFQRSEFLLEKGFIDKIVGPKDMRDTLSKILRLHSIGGEVDE